jgi:hypothetical protein
MITGSSPVVGLDRAASRPALPLVSVLPPVVSRLEEVVEAFVARSARAANHPEPVARHRHRTGHERWPDG